MTASDHLQRAKELEREAEDLADRQKKYGEASRVASMAAREYGAGDDYTKQQELDARTDYYNALHYFVGPQVTQLDMALSLIERASEQFEKLGIELWIKERTHKTPS
jgi:regulator of protease activity HflC (stomatin/prohibitin superfamily)